MAKFSFPTSKVFIVAELSGNHLQDYSRAEKLVRAAAAAGADAVKLQTYTADTMTLDSDNKWFQVGGGDNPKEWAGQTLYELYQKASTPWDWHPKLRKLAEELGLIFFSTPFDDTAVDFLERLDVPLYKIASYEATDIPLLKKVASAGKPVIMSMGFASLPEIDEAVRTLRENGAASVALLHCVTMYSDKPNLRAMNFGNIADLGKRFGVVPGFSDNNAGTEAPVAAVAAGARIVEKHLTLSRTDGGPDAQFSLEPSEFKEMVEKIRNIDISKYKKIPASVHYGPANESEQYNMRYRRSVFAANIIKRGEKFTPANIRVIRPAFGLAPKYYEALLGTESPFDLPAAEPLPQVREAASKDSKAIWSIRNHPDVCAASMNREPIPYERHEPWFEKQYLSRSGNRCFVLEKESQVAGYCRFDQQSDGRFRVSIAINPESRGQGLGGYLLRLSLSDMRGAKFSAEAAVGNDQSLALFKKFGFRVEREDEEYYYLSL